MTLEALDAADLFSLTLWRSTGGGYTVGVQKHAGDLVKYETRPTASAAIEAVLAAGSVLVPPCPVLA